MSTLMCSFCRCSRRALTKVGDNGLPIMVSSATRTGNGVNPRYFWKVCSRRGQTFCTAAGGATSQTTSEPAGDKTPHTGKSTVDQSEVDKFSCLAGAWWEENGEFKALHTLNRLRVPLIRDTLTSSGSHGDRGQREAVLDPLAGQRVLDVGCGGGILTEALARLGGRVTGIDASEENIKIAESHSKRDPRLVSSDRMRYVWGRIEDLAVTEGNQYDGVVASEILEHVTEPQTFVKACCQLTKPGGSLFFTTLNKTLASRLIAVYAAERVLRLVPAGAHDWDKFVTPDDLTYMLQLNGATVRLVHGMTLNPMSLRWTWTRDTSMNYALHAVKVKDTQESDSDTSSSDSDRG